MNRTELFSERLINGITHLGLQYKLDLIADLCGLGDEVDLGAYVGLDSSRNPIGFTRHDHRSLVDVNQAIIASKASKCLI